VRVFLWEMALDLGFDVTFDNMCHWKTIPEKAWKVNNAIEIIRITNNKETPR
jgi:hypothetical protein